MCGKDCGGHVFCYLLVGSPPHVRERPIRRGIFGVSSGITPACAGKTVPDTVRLHGSEDHPRMCGKDLL